MTFLPAGILILESQFSLKHLNWTVANSQLRDAYCANVSVWGNGLLLVGSWIASTRLSSWFVVPYPASRFRVLEKSKASIAILGSHQAKWTKPLSEESRNSVASLINPWLFVDSLNLFRQNTDRPQKVHLLSHVKPRRGHQFNQL